MPFPALYPPADAHEFASLKPKVRERAWALYHAAQEIHAAGSGKRVETCKRIAAAMGKKSWKSIYHPVSDYLQSYDWRVLIDRRHHSDLWVSKSTAPSFHPAEFLADWHDRALSQHRCAKTAYRLLMLDLAAWRRGDSSKRIAGYTTPPPNAPGCRHPRKWSYRDLCRALPSKISVAAIRHGRDAAMQMLPAIRTTRKGGYPGMEFQFDDRWIDVNAVYGTSHISRILEFACIEYYSGYHFSPWLRPRLNLDGVNKSLSERDFRLFSVAFAATVGWSPRGSVYRGERGLCAFRAGLDEKFRRHSRDLIKIVDPGMSGQAAYVGGFAELAKGNPNAKALKEGMGGFLHNLLGGLAGQSGSSPADEPASHVGREAETRALLALQGVIGRPLTLAHHTFDQVCAAIFKAYEIANTRIDHQCEGWLEENLVTDEFCVDPAADLWLPVSKLDPQRRAALAILGDSLGNLIRPRLMSAAEVMDPALKGFLRLSHEAIADCIYEDVRRKVTITEREASFRDLANYGPGTYRYPASFQRPDGFPRTLPDGEQLWLVVHPAMPDTGYYYDFEGCYLGRVARKHDISRHDADRIKREIGKKVALYNDATLAAQVRAGLKRASALTDNAAALMDALRDDVRREMGVLPRQGTRGDSTRVPLSELFDPTGDPPETPEPAAVAGGRDPLSILLGTH
jgi:hypothetical protein